MKHLGDITKIDGSKIPKVDVITFGAPCQDLSVAGSRKGLLHTALGDNETTRSGLFMEAVRIIKEMRGDDKANGRADFFIRPRYALYENVPGAYSSNKGADFQTVLTEIVRIAEPESPDVPLPEKGKWSKAGCLMGDAWSIAWKLHDAQYWGVPQRRKRIALLADFNGHSAPRILFGSEYRRIAEGRDANVFKRCFGGECRSEVQSQPESVSGNSESGKSKEQGTSGDSENFPRETGTISFQERAGGGIRRKRNLDSA